MNKDILKGQWKTLKGKAKQQWGKLTDDETDRLEGNYDELVGTIQSKYGYEKDRASKEVNDFIDKNKH